jgi:4-carboxymuconolactone decarboxylase
MSGDEMAVLGDRGRAEFAELVPGGDQLLDAVFEAVPDLADFAVGSVYGHLHDRQVLDGRTREVVALAAIIASGCFGSPLSVHVKTGRAAGLSTAEIREIVLVAAAFVGFPRAVSASVALSEAIGARPVGERTPRELLLELVQGADDCASSAVPVGALQRIDNLRRRDLAVRVLTVTAESAVALFTSAAGGLVAVLHACVQDGHIAELQLLP